MLQLEQGKSTRMRQLKTHREVIAYLGGPEGIASIEPALSPEEVRHWNSAGIPNSWHYRIHLWCAARGAHVAPSAFGFTDDGMTAKSRPVKRQLYAGGKKRRGKVR